MFFIVLIGFYVNIFMKLENIGRDGRKESG